MIRIAFVVAALTVFPLTAFAGPKEEAQALADKFIAAFAAGDLEATTALFSPDALFWGTMSPELGTSAELREYFVDNFAARAKVPLTGASITNSTVSVLSDDAVVIAGLWRTERPTGVSVMRYSFVMHKKDGQWRIAHFHSSPRPKQ